MRDILVLILAGGDSTRMWPIKNKLTLKFLNIPAVYYLFRQLARFGFKKCVVVTKSQNDDIFEKLKRQYPNLEIKTIPQGKTQGMAGAVISAQSLIMGKPVLILSPADFFQDTLFADFSDILKNNPDGVIAGKEMASYFPGGYLTVENSLVQDIIEKPDKDKTPGKAVSLVFDYIKNADILLEALYKSHSLSDDLFEKALQATIKNGLKYHFLPYEGFWGYLKYPWHILAVSNYFLEIIKGFEAKNAVIDETAVIRGNVIVGEGARVSEFTKIVGPAYIGKGAIVGNHTMIRQSMIGANTVVGFGTEITRSYVGENCWFHNNYIGDSVIDNGVSFGAGAITANFRLDEDIINSPISGKIISTEKTKLGAIIGANARIGINASLMPGIKIGQNTIIAPDCLVKDDIKDNMYLSQKKVEYILIENKFNLNDSDREKIRKNL